MNRMQSLYRLEFDDNSIVNKKIQPAFSNR